MMLAMYEAKLPAESEMLDLTAVSSVSLDVAPPSSSDEEEINGASLCATVDTRNVVTDGAELVEGGAVLLKGGAELVEGGVELVEGAKEDNTDCAGSAAVLVADIMLVVVGWVGTATLAAAVRATGGS